jgi:outer membrane usher protein
MMHSGRYTILVGTLSLLALASPSATAAAASDQHAVLALSLDEVDKGTIVAVIRGKEVLASVPDLEKAGVTLAGGPYETIGGTPFVALSTLAPAITYRLDEASATLVLKVAPSSLKSNNFDLTSSPRPADLVYGRTNSAFVNYALSTNNLNTPGFFTEQGVSIDGVLFDNTLSYAASGLTRTGTRLIFDDPNSLTRLTFGDFTAISGLLGGSTNMIGVNFSRDYAINPYFVTYPLQTFAGNVNVPSTAYVYVNGRLVRTIELAPGPFDLQNVPVASGANATRVVIQNVYGQQQLLEAPFYLGINQLRQGLSQYNFSLGAERSPVFSGLGDYGRLASLAFYRYGWTDWLTMGGFVESDGPVETAGAEVDLGLSELGQLGLTGSGSRTNNGSGRAGGVQYSYRTLDFTLGADYLWESNRYGALGLTPDQDRTSRRYDLQAGTSISDTGVAASYTHLADRDLGRQTQINLTFTQSLGDYGQVSLILGQSRLPHTAVNDSALLTFTVPLEPGTSASSSVQRSEGTWLGTAQVQKSLPLGEGWGYSLTAQTGKGAAQSGNLEYQSPYGFYELNALHVGGQTTVLGTVSGGLVYIGDRLMPTRALQDAYALIRVPEVPGATVDLSNQPVGRTDSEGDLIIPNLQSYYGNQISLDDNTVPLNFAIDSTKLGLAPPYRGGAIALFPVHRIQALEGRLDVAVAGRNVALAGDLFTLAAEGKTFTSPLGTDGAFYLENVPPGRYKAEVIYAGGTCRLAVTVPKSDALVIQLGTIACTQN